VGSLTGRPLVFRTEWSATEGIYGLILALSVIAVAREYDSSPDAGLVGLSVLITAVVFYLAHAYSDLLGRGVSQGQELTPGAVGHAMRSHFSLIAVPAPLLAVLGAGALGWIPDRTSLLAAIGIALAELAAAGGYAALRQGAGPRGTIVSAAVAVGLGAVIVLLKALAH
jgi:hypothetical protein